MRITVSFLLCMFFGTATVQAQELNNLLAVLPTATFLKPPPDAPPSKPKVFDKKVWFVGALLVGSMSADVKSTMDTRGRCLGGCHDMTQGVDWFVAHGPAATYAAGLAIDSGVMYVAYRMKKSSNPLLRHTWFVPPIAIAIGHLLATRDNYRLPYGATAGYK